MTQDEIIEIAKQADMTSMEMFGAIKFIEVWAPDLQRFAKLVAAKERRDCAKACAELGEWACVHAIEARGQE
jgi:hypothetical protein